MKTLISQELLTSIKNLYSQKKDNDEFELIIRSKSLKNTSIGFLRYFRILKYLGEKSKKKFKIAVLNTLDINCSISDNNKNITNIRVTISGIENINQLLSKSIYSKLQNANFFKKILTIKEDYVTIIVKTKKSSNIIDIDDYNIRIRLSKEDEKSALSEKILSLMNTSICNINYRYKQRVSLFLDDSTSIDLTTVRQSLKRWNINTRSPLYELEVDTSGKSSTSIELILSECETLLKKMEESSHLISKTEKTKVVDYYFSIANNGKKMDKLDARKPISLELKNVTKDIPNKYYVTDKADGNRYFLIIYAAKVYLISYNLDVLFTGITLNGDKWNGSILDGEYLTISGKNVFLCFDCLFYGSNDMRTEKKLLTRLTQADTLIKECFVFEKQIGHSFDELYKIPTDKTKDTLLNNLENSLCSYMSTLNNDIKHTNKYPLIRRKYFAQIIGIDSGEIFRNSSMIWKKYVLDSTIACPYHLDGLIFQPQIQSYITNFKNSEYKLPDYKWKPREHNSIDFYIEFDKDQSGKQNIYYDNTLQDNNNNKPYKIAHLFVGFKDRNTRSVVPILFMEKTKKYIAHLFLVNGEARDENGIVLQDKSVVEFTYNMNLSIPQAFRWIARNIRFDKTERLNSGIKEYGNYFTTAKNVWDTMNNPLTLDDFDLLGSGKELSINDKGFKQNNNSQIKTKQSAGYYQNIVTIAMPMKRFHNFIKANMISAYVDSNYFGDNVSVLDLACGRGGDINKFYYKNISKYVGVDIDNDGLMNNIDGALTRYRNLTKKNQKKSGPKMEFVHANIGALLNVAEQQKAIGKMTPTNERLINESITNNKFDIINCQFAVHYLLKDDVTWNNFLKNINNHLKIGGFLLLTTFDGKKVDDLFANGKTRYDSSYIDSNGNTKNLFTIIKNYDEKSKINGKYYGVGNAINYTNILMFSEEVFYTEYIVDSEFLELELKTKCGMKLVDSDSFENQYNLHKEYFKTGANVEHNKYKKTTFSELSKFYDLTDSINSASYSLTKLNKYYVFKKTADIKSGGTIQNKYGMKKFTTKKYSNYFDPPYYFVTTIKPSLSKFSFHIVIYDIMKTHSVISNNTTMADFYAKFNHKIIIDNRVTNTVMSKICAFLNINIVIIKNNIKTIIKKTAPSIGSFDEGVKIIIVDMLNDKYRYLFINNMCLYDRHDLVFLMKLK